MLKTRIDTAAIASPKRAPPTDLNTCSITEVVCGAVAASQAAPPPANMTSPPHIKRAVCWAATVALMACFQELSPMAAILPWNTPSYT